MNEEAMEQNPEEVNSENSNVNEAPQATNDNEQTKNMEVHKHPHHVTHKKKWGEYLLEFFMLFLAVFLGFIAENIRENSVNRETEKNNIESLVRNLREDSLNLVRTCQVNEKRFMYLDSLIDLKNSSVSDTIFQHHFIYYDLKLG